MTHNNIQNLDDLISKVDQHEETITQLVNIIAQTNRRISELTQQHNQSEQSNVVTL